MINVLLIDDDRRHSELLSEYCRRFGIEVDCVYDGREALQRIAATNPDLLLLDVMLPGKDGFALCREIRRGSKLPIIMLTARGDVVDRVTGLELGADDYIAKPFEPRELVARIQTVLRRIEPTADRALIEYEGLSIDTTSRTVLTDGAAVELTTMEYELLLLLASHPGRDYSRDEILAAVARHRRGHSHARGGHPREPIARQAWRQFQARTLDPHGLGSRLSLHRPARTVIGRFSHSLSLRLSAIFLLLAALFAWGVVSGIRWAYSADDLRSLISGHLSLHVDYVRQDIGSPPRLDRALAITQRVPVDIHIEGPGVRWSSDPAFPEPATLEFGPSDYFSSEPGALLDELEGVVFAVRDNHRFLKFNEGGYEIIVATPRIADHRSRPPLIPILVGFALLLVLCAYLAVGWLFRPIATIREGAAYIGAGHFNHRIRTRRDDELGELAEDINRMAGKVDGMLDAKRQLLMGVSHELRSPISRITLGLALLEESSAVRALQQDASGMASIVGMLLEAERFDSPHATLQLSMVSLDGLVRDLVARHFPDEPRLITRVSGESHALLDASRIQLMLKSLLDNALRYSSAADGPVELDIDTEGGQLVFQVRDHGPGIPEAQRGHIGEPFYRADASRTRDTGGTGLGLYLVRQIARAHGGDLELREAAGRGALFVVSLPLRRSQ